MSDPIKHECGIALLRLKQPLHCYQEKYGSAFYGLKKLYLLMQKQHNRGQDGAGVANIKLNMPPGSRYISRVRSNSSQPIEECFQKINSRFHQLQKDQPEKLKDVDWLKNNEAFTGELLLGHVRYGTFGKNKIENCHPFLRQNNWMTRNLVVAGNFNLTNVEELFGQLVEYGQHPKEMSDTVTVLEKIGHFLDKENEKLYRKYSKEGYSKKDISTLIGQTLDVPKVLRKASEKWDGGYVMAGLLGHGDAFVLRDPNSIRPAFYYEDDEITVVCSERPAIQTAFNVNKESIKELKGGHALLIDAKGQLNEVEINKPGEKTSCSFERIYFSRGSDEDIYKERIQLGRSLSEKVLQSIDFDTKRSVFSFIPNTAETAFIGLVKGVEAYLNEVKKKKILELGTNPSEEEISNILDNIRPRIHKAAIKDMKLRTFITEDDSRDDLVEHVYDITYGLLQPNEENLVVIDDSIVRGTTLKNSIIRMLDRLQPKKMVIISSAPQIRYPDCYGIDMAKIGDFIAFKAAVALLKEQYKENLLEEVYERCKASEANDSLQEENFVKAIYEPFTPDEISTKIAELLRPEGVNAEVTIVYQTIEGLREACPDHTGDWYFTGNYPTPGGNKVVNKAFMNYMEGKSVRAY